MLRTLWFLSLLVLSYEVKAGKPHVKPYGKANEKPHDKPLSRLKRSFDYDDDYSYGREDSNTMFNGIQDDDFTEIRIQFVEMIIEKNDNMESVLETFVNFQNAGGVFGDPHFVLPLTPRLSVCFNWQEPSDEFDNLISTDSHYVNARMLPMKTPTQLSLSEKPRVFVSALAFVIPQYKLNILVHPRRITYKFTGSENATEFPLTTESSFTHKRVILQVDETHKRSHFLTLLIEDTVYKIILRASTPEAAPHVNFYFNNLTSTFGVDTDRAHTVDGIAGQFYAREAKIVRRIDAKRAILKVGDDIETKVRRHKMNGVNPFTGKTRHCWLIPNEETHRFFVKHKDKYQMEHLISKPKYFTGGEGIK